MAISWSVIEDDKKKKSQNGSTAASSSNSSKGSYDTSPIKVKGSGVSYSYLENPTPVTPSQQATQANKAVQSQPIATQPQQPEQNIFQKFASTVSNIWTNLSNLGQDNSYQDVSGKQKVEKVGFENKLKELGADKITQSEVVNLRKNDPVGYFTNRPFYTSDQKLLRNDPKDVSGLNVIDDKLAAFEDYKKSLTPEQYKRFTNPYKNVSDDVYSYVSLNASNIKLNVQQERKEVEMKLKQAIDTPANYEGNGLHQSKEATVSTLQDRLNLLSDQEKNLDMIEKGMQKNENFFKGFYDNAALPIVGSVFKAIDQKEAMTALRKVDNKEPLTERDQLALDKIKNNTFSDFTKDQKIDYQLGAGLSGSLTMMAEFALALALPATKAIEGVEIGTGAAGKAASWTAQTLLKAGQVTATTQAPKIFETAYQYQTPTFNYNWKDNAFDKVAEGDPQNAKTWLKAVASVYGNNVIELGLGDALDEGGKAVKTLAVQNLGKSAETTELGVVKSFLKEKGGFDGFWGEFSEEIAQKYYEEGVIKGKQFTGLQDTKDKQKQFNFTPSELATIAASVMLIQGVMAAPDTVIDLTKKQESIDRLEFQIKQTIQTSVDNEPIANNQNIDNPAPANIQQTVTDVAPTVNTNAIDTNAPSGNVADGQINMDLQNAPADTQAQVQDQTNTQSPTLTGADLLKADLANLKSKTVSNVASDQTSVTQNNLTDTNVTSSSSEVQTNINNKDGLASTNSNEQGLTSSNESKTTVNPSNISIGTKALSVDQINKSELNTSISPELKTQVQESLTKGDGDAVVHAIRSEGTTTGLLVTSAGGNVLEDVVTKDSSTSIPIIQDTVKQYFGDMKSFEINKPSASMQSALSSMGTIEMQQDGVHGKFTWNPEVQQQVTSDNKQIKQQERNREITKEIKKQLKEKISVLDKSTSADTVSNRQKNLYFNQSDHEAQLKFLQEYKDLNKEFKAGKIDGFEFAKKYNNIQSRESLDTLPFRTAPNGTQILDSGKITDPEIKRVVNERLQTLSNNLFGDSNIDVVEKLTTPQGREAWGRYSNSWIDIVNGSAQTMEDTFYHESVHKALDLFFTTEEKARVINQAIKVYGETNLKLRWDRSTIEDKSKMASFQSTNFNVYEQNRTIVQEAGIGIKDTQLVPMLNELNVDPKQAWNNVVQSVDAQGVKSIFIVQGEEDAIHAVSLIGEGLKGEEGKVWSIKPINEAQLTNPHSIIEGKLNPSTLPYSTENEVKQAQKNYKTQFGVGNVGRGGEVSTVSSVSAMAEEQLAEDMIKYVNNEKTFIGKVKNLLDYMKDRISNVLNGDVSITGLYRDLYSGKLLNEDYRPSYLYGDRPKLITKWAKSYEESVKNKNNVEYFREAQDLPTEPDSLLEQTTSIKLPELLAFSDSILNGNINIVEKLGKAVGVFRSTEGTLENASIKLKNELFKPKTEKQLDPLTGKVRDVKVETEEERRTRVEMIEKVLAHEIGHLVDFDGGEDNLTLQRGNLLGRIANLKAFMEKEFKGLDNKEIKSQLQTLTQLWNPFDVTEDEKYTKYRFNNKELYADAVSVLLNKPELLKQVAPDFYQGFLENIDSKAEVKDNLFEVMDMIQEGREIANRLDKMDEGFKQAQDRRMNIAEREGNRKLIKNWEDVRKNFAYALVSEFDPYVSKLRTKLKEKGISLSKYEEAQQVLENLKYIGNKSKRYADDVQESFIDPVVNAGIEMDTVGQILVLERNLGDRLDLANPQGLIYDYAKETYDKVKEDLGIQKWMVLQDRLTWLRDRNFKIVEEAYKNGLFSKEFFDTVATVSKNTYTPFAVVKYIENNYVTAGVIQAKGTVSTVENPIVTSMLKSTSIIRASEVNKVKAYVTSDLISMFGEDIFEAKAIRGEDGKFIDWAKDPSAKERNMQVVSLMVDGKLTGYYVDPYIHAMFEGKSGVGWNVGRAIVYPFRMFNRVFKPLVTTLKPSFAFYSNILKDTERSGTNLATLLGVLDENSTIGKKLIGYRANYLKQWMKNLKRSWNFAGEDMDSVTKEMIDNFAIDYTKQYDPETEGDDTLLFDPVKQKIYGKQQSVELVDWIRQTGEKIPLVKQLVVPIYNFYIRTGATFEVNSKIAGYQFLKEQGLNSDKAAYYTRKYVGTPDYKQGGRFTEFSNQAIPFSNIAIQAIKTDLELATNPTTRSGWWMQKFLTTAMPKMLMLMGAGLLKYTDKDKKEHSMYDLISEYTKTNYLVFPLGMRNGKVVALKIPQDETSRLLGAAIWKMGTYLQGKGMKIEQLASLTAGITPFVTGDNPLWGITNDWMDYFQGRNPYDDFRGRPAISTSKWDEGGIVRFKEMLKWTSDSTGATTFGTYDDATKDGFEKVMSAPIVERMFEVTNYGLQEREKFNEDTQGMVKKQDRRKFMGEFMKNPSDENLLTQTNAYLEATYGKEPPDGWTGSEAQKVTFARKDFKRFILENSGKSEYKSISASGLSNEEKVQTVDLWSKRMDEQKFADYNAQLVKYEIISPDVYVESAKASGISSATNYNVVKESLPFLTSTQRGDLVSGLRKNDLLSNDDLKKLRDDGLLTVKGYSTYIQINKKSADAAAKAQDQRDLIKSKSKVNTSNF